MTHAPRDGMMPLPRLTAPARSCDTDKVQRPPSWLQKKWIQALLAQAIDGSQQEPEQDAAEAVSSLMLTIAQLRYLPSAQEAECIKVPPWRMCLHCVCLRLSSTECKGT